MPSIIGDKNIIIMAPGYGMAKVEYSEITKILMVRDPNSADWIGRLYRNERNWIACSVGSYYHVKDYLDGIVARVKKVGGDVKIEEDATVKV